MRQLLRLITVLVCGAYSLGCPAQSPGPSFVAAYYPAKAPRNAAIVDGLKRNQIPERFAAMLSQKILLPTPVQLTFAECGQENAFYEPNARRIRFCLELLDKIHNLARVDLATRLPSDRINAVAWGAVTFILFHETGHALTHILNVPKLGREEDVADQLATYLILQTKEPETPLLGGVWFFKGSTLVDAVKRLIGTHLR